MHITTEDVKLIHDLGWALMPYAFMIWFGISIIKMKFFINAPEEVKKK